MRKECGEEGRRQEKRREWNEVGRNMKREEDCVRERKVCRGSKIGNRRKEVWKGEKEVEIRTGKPGVKRREKMGRI